MANGMRNAPPPFLKTQDGFMGNSSFDQLTVHSQGVGKLAVNALFYSTGMQYNKTQDMKQALANRILSANDTIDRNI